MKTFLIYTFSALVILLSGCNKDKIPGVYRIDIQQGNAVNQDMINKLKPGMTKKQVAYIMGTPLIIDTFHPNRWDYIYSFHQGNSQREQRKLTLYFTEAETLSHLDGDINTVARDELPETEHKTSNVIVPLSDKSTGLIQNLLNTIGFGDEEAQQEIAQPDDELQSEINADNAQ